MRYAPRNVYNQWYNNAHVYTRVHVLCAVSVFGHGKITRARLARRFAHAPGKTTGRNDIF